MTGARLLLVGTMTGTAQLVAQEMELALDDGDTQVVTKLLDGLDASVLADRSAVYLVCTSTYGQGDVPDNARKLYEELNVFEGLFSRSKPFCIIICICFGFQAVAVQVFRDFLVSKAQRWAY